MKIAVSLLPAEYRREIEKSRKLLVARKGMVVALVLLLALGMGTSVLRVLGTLSIDRIAAQQAAAEQTIAELQPYQALESERNQLSAKVETAQNLDGRWLDVAAELGDQVPTGVWIESLATAETEGVQTCQLTCGAVNYTGVAQYMEALKESSMVVDVVCDTTAENGSAVTFSLNVTLAAPSQR